MEYPDQLKTPVHERSPGSADLGDLLADELLRDAASWDPDVEPPVPAIPGREPAEIAERLRNGGPEPAYQALRRLARLGALHGVRWPPGWPTAARPGATRPFDPLAPSGTAAGLATACAVGVQEALKTPGVRLLCITGSAGVGKTRLALDIVRESREKILAAAPEERAVPLLTIRLRSLESGAGRRRLVMTPYDALMDLLLALGVAEHDIPATLGERRARYVAELRGCRPVILVDDAVAESQLEPLLPPEAGVVVITSRRGLDWSAITGVVRLPLAALDAWSTNTLVQDTFQACGAQADDATAAAIHDWCRGTPLPVILVSRWLATTTQPTTSLEAARQDWDRSHGQLAVEAVLEGFQAVAAMLSLLGDDQQMIVRMFGLLRLPEADLASACAGTGLSRVRALAALRQLTDVGLLAGADSAGADSAGADSAGAWVMPKAIADYAFAWACEAEPRPADTYQQLLDPLLGLYESRVQGLLDTHAVLAQADEDAAAEWMAAEVQVARDVIATALDAAGVTGQLSRARGLASAYLAATAALGGRPSGTREVERFIGPVLAVAKAAGDGELAAGALERFSGDDVHQGEATAALGEALPESGPHQQTGPTSVPGKSGLDEVDKAIQEGRTGPPEHVIFGARA